MTCLTGGYTSSIARIRLTRRPTKSIWKQVATSGPLIPRLNSRGTCEIVLRTMSLSRRHLPKRWKPHSDVVLLGCRICFGPFLMDQYGKVLLGSKSTLGTDHDNIMRKRRSGKNIGKWYQSIRYQEWKVRNAFRAIGRESLGIEDVDTHVSSMSQMHPLHPLNPSAFESKHSRTNKDRW
ncbi:hypothetical protein GQ43DRAFT_145813 [Delitschia confertaspora ATCC 74209]|uniref:Uncharacterized protein n=1 Tax=Delitschia confertaspora ATCC 74209 TaxID=1513339 RepID=A0A9P4JGL1_9PLEO|nr:hypothetical protein GQ43DRAFT_145813 [Delitschia confertaspora ATCC 74209]